MSEDPIRRGARWKLFLEEEGGVADMLAEIRQTYLERIAAADPSDTGKLQVLAMAHFCGYCPRVPLASILRHVILWSTRVPSTT